jgi:hemerythrin-like domain-containing protein
MKVNCFPSRYRSATSPLTSWISASRAKTASYPHRAPYRSLQISSQRNIQTAYLRKTPLQLSYLAGRHSITSPLTRICYSKMSSSSAAAVPSEQEPGAQESLKEQGKAPESEAASEQKPELPPLKPAEFKEYNRLAERMELFVSYVLKPSGLYQPKHTFSPTSPSSYTTGSPPLPSILRRKKKPGIILTINPKHNHFRQSWTLLYNAATANKRPSNMTLRQFLEVGTQLCRHLTAHHDIEESYFFPILAKRMPEFRPGRNTHLIKQHRQIHAGMDAFEDYIRACRAGDADFSMKGLKERMDSWGDVLWKHLDDEVRTLGAENMRRYWSLEEIRRLQV